MIGAALIPALVTALTAVDGIRQVREADELADLIAAKSLPQTVPAAFALVVEEQADTLARTVHTARIVTTLAVVLVDRPRRETQANALGDLGEAVIAALAGRVLIEGWTPLGYRGASQQVRAAATDRQGGLFLTIYFTTATTRRALI